MHEIIAIVFDFDDTLVPDSTSSFLNSIGIDVPKFWGETVQALLDNDWDPMVAALYGILEISRSQEKGIKKRDFATWGRKLTPYPGVTTIFNRVKKHAKGENPNVEVEFYIISSGIGEIIRHTKIAHHFKDIWTSDFTYDPKTGRIGFPKRIISFTDKTRYLFHISKGLIGDECRSRPFDVNKKLEDDQMRIPLYQVIYVGDGFTDVPCFSLIRKFKGIPIGVYDKTSKKKWGRAWGFIEDDRVMNLAPANYCKDAALADSLLMAVESIARNIRLQSKIYQG